jgi:hypothetical protein
MVPIDATKSIKDLKLQIVDLLCQGEEKKQWKCLQLLFEGHYEMADCFKVGECIND